MAKKIQKDNAVAAEAKLAITAFQPRLAAPQKSNCLWVGALDAENVSPAGQAHTG